MLTLLLWRMMLLGVLESLLWLMIFFGIPGKREVQRASRRSSEGSFGTKLEHRIREHGRRRRKRTNDQTRHSKLVFFVQSKYFDNASWCLKKHLNNFCLYATKKIIFLQKIVVWCVFKTNDFYRPEI